MDPNEALKRARELAAQLLKANEESVGDADGVASLGVELAEQVQALDGWLTLGGFLPSDWKAR